MIDFRIFLIIGLVIIIHHFIKHENDNMPHLSKFIQYNDINNHETWALFSFGIAIGIYINKYIGKSTQ